jgi:two-component system chemotaxis response regulator CheB
MTRRDDDNRMPMPERPIRVLVLDASPEMRQALAGLLSTMPGLEVSTCADLMMALQRISRVRPDVIVLDQAMEGADTIPFLRRLMVAPRPIPVVVLADSDEAATDVAVRLLEEGAVAVASRPSLRDGRTLQETGGELAAILREASQARLDRLSGDLRQLLATDVIPPLNRRLRAVAPTGALVAIGAPMGGAEALRGVLQDLPEDSAAVAIVHSVPRPFSGAFLKRLSQVSSIEVKEAVDGDELTSGRALVAPGDRHFFVEKKGEKFFARLSHAKRGPSADVLFRSVARAAGSSGVGVLLMGSGTDGVAGMSDLRAAGGRTLAQSESSCVLSGAVREAIARGAVQRSLPLDGLAAAIARGG